LRKKKLALIGYGYLNQHVGYAVISGILKGYELVGVLGRNPERTQMVADHYNCVPCETIEELMDLEPDFVVEAASREALLDYGEAVLKGGANLVMLSASVLADINFFERLKETAKENNTRIYLPGGAVGGFDLIRTAALMSTVEVTMTSKRGPQSLYYSPYYRNDLAMITEPERVFEGSITKLMEEYPFSYNVAMATGLATVGPENIKFNIEAVPNFKGDEYNIHVKGEEVDINLNIITTNYNIAAWSVVTMLRNAVSTVVF